MSLESILTCIGDAVSRKAGVESVYGTPIHVGDRILIPVARIQYGFGGGDNQGVLGGGGGMEATPVGLLEIHPHGVTFHPIGGGQDPLLQRPEINEVSPGIFKVERPGSGGVHCWLLVNGEQGALVNAPPDAALASFLAEQAGSRKIRIRSIFLNQTDYRHAGGLRDLLQIFPEAGLVAHRSVEHASGFPPLPGEGDPESWRLHLPQEPVRFAHTFDERMCHWDLDGEPLFLIYSPLNNWTDHDVLFRGALLTGDGSAGSVGPEARAETMASVARSLSGSYDIHTTLPSQGEPRAGLSLI
jgi:uncharacterized spore protein YtfJ